MPKHVSVETLERMVLKLGPSLRPLSGSLRKWEGDLSSGCESPVTVEFHSRATENLGRLRSNQRVKHMTVILHTKCRHCDVCLAKRAAHWRFRCRAEHELCEGRTWFGTLTLSAAQHFNALAWVWANCRRQGIDFDSLSDKEKFQYLEATEYRGLKIKPGSGLVQNWPSVTHYLKRVRKASNASFRYLVVTERHEGGGENHGRPHFHVLLHELDQTIRHKVLKSQWGAFSDWKLVKTDSDLTYSVKYLSKNFDVAPRASKYYGNGNPQAKAAQGLGNRVNQRPENNTPLTSRPLVGFSQCEASAYQQTELIE